MMHIALSTRILAPLRGQGCRACLSKRKPYIPLYPVVCLAFSLLVSTVNVFDHISASSRMRPAPRGRYRGGLVIGGCGCVGGPTLSCERELACSCFASPQYTIPVLPSSPSALSTSGGPLLFVTCWPKWSAGPLRVQVVAVGVSSASSARNPCRPASCLHADLHSTYSRTAVHYRQQLYELRLYSKDRLADFPATKAHKSKQALRRSHHLSIDCSC